MTDNILNPSAVTLDYIAALQQDYNKNLTRIFRGQAQHLIALSHAKLTYISDNGTGDLASSEIKTHLAQIGTLVSGISEKPPVPSRYEDVPSQNWRAASFTLSQLSRGSVLGAGEVYFLNCAPRLDQRGKDKNNGGEGIFIGILPNNAVVTGVSAHSFAFFRDLVETGELKIYQANVQKDGSQFRSRDIFPWYATLLTHGLNEKAEQWYTADSVADREALLETFGFVNTKNVLSLEHIPDVFSTPSVALIDAHGNLKLSVREENLPQELLKEPVLITVNGHGIETQFSKSMFDKGSNQYAFSTGSSGHFNDRADPKAGFLELAIIGNRLADALEITQQHYKEGIFPEFCAR